MSKQIGGKVREERVFNNTPKVGFFEGEVVSINPDKEELVTLLRVGEDKIDNFKEPEYLGKSEKSGADTVIVNVRLKAVKGGEIFSKNFFLEKRERTKKDNTSRFQYINSIGRTAWATTEDELKPKFKEREYRKAYIGEEYLYNFLRVWMRGLDFNDPETTLSLDVKDLFNGNVKILKKQIGGEYTKNKEGKPYTVVGMLEVRTVEEGEGENKEVKLYQNINDRFLPGYAMKFIRTTRFTQENIDAWAEKRGSENEKGEKVYLKDHEDFAVQISDREHGSKNFFFLGEAKDYDPTEDPVGVGQKPQPANAEDNSY